jgi:hypothetical protein
VCTKRCINAIFLHNSACLIRVLQVSLYAFCMFCVKRSQFWHVFHLRVKCRLKVLFWHRNYRFVFCSKLFLHGVLCYEHIKCTTTLRTCMILSVKQIFYLNNTQGFLRILNKTQFTSLMLYRKFNYLIKSVLVNAWEITVKNPFLIKIKC